ncbi:MAG TPA: MFS transporter [Thermoanaerobaculia bacterium]|nr:MFS transporter [Thermoanaerobaculia bacterium]
MGSRQSAEGSGETDALPLPTANRPLPTRSWLIPSLAAVLYFAQGFPFGFVTDLMPAYLRKAAYSRTEIALIQTVALAWVWKVLWAPAVDAFASYRRWMAMMLATMTIAIVAIAFLPASNTPAIWTLITVIALASATQDIAIDAMAIRITPQKLLGIVNSMRVAAYRGAFILAGGAIVSLSDFIGWRGSFLTAAAITGGLFAFTFMLPHETGESVHRESPFAGLGRWMKLPRAWQFLLIAFFYKLGDFALQPMAKIYWIDRGFSMAEVGTATTTVGISFLIAGAFVGGIFIARFGIFHGLLWLGIAQMLSNAGYAIVASTTAGRPVLYSVVIIENFTGGLGTAAFLAFLMAICEREHAATQFAMLSALFGLSRSAIGSVSGFGVDHLGYPLYFWITTALALPGLLLVPLVRNDALIAPRKEELLDV